MFKRRVIPVLVALLIVFAGIRVLTFLSQPPATLGASRSGQLAKTTGKPNCVSSQVPKDHPEYIEPLAWPGTVEDPIGTLADKIKTLSKTRIVTQTSSYMHVEFRSLVLGFVDDVEFVCNTTQGVIDVRSASRMGYSDMGANRRRVEQIRRLWAGGN